MEDSTKKSGLFHLVLLHVVGWPEDTESQKGLGRQGP